MPKTNTFKVTELNDDCLVSQRYMIMVNGVFYTSNISRQLVKQYVKKLVQQGYVSL